MTCPFLAFQALRIYQCSRRLGEMWRGQPPSRYRLEIHQLNQIIDVRSAKNRKSNLRRYTGDIKVGVASVLQIDGSTLVYHEQVYTSSDSIGTGIFLLNRA
jgi:hypothetical protein